MITHGPLGLLYFILHLFRPLVLGPAPLRFTYAILSHLTHLRNAVDLVTTRKSSEPGRVPASQSNLASSSGL